MSAAHASRPPQLPASRPLHVAIVGSRLRLSHLPASMRAAVIESARSAVEQFVAALPPATVVISGGAVGVDTFAHDAAWRRYQLGSLGRPIVCQVPVPRRHGSGREVRLTRGEFSRLAKARNQRIVNLLAGEEDYLMAFWDGTSRGTQDVMERARKAGKLREAVKLDLVELLRGVLEVPAREAV